MDPADGMSDDRLSALNYRRNEQFARMIATMIELAAESHPHIIRDAICKVFDTRGWQKNLDTLSFRFKELHTGYVELRERLLDMQQEIDRLQHRG